MQCRVGHHNMWLLIVAAHKGVAGDGCVLWVDPVLWQPVATKCSESVRNQLWQSLCSTTTTLW